MTIYAVNGKEPIAAWIPSLDTAGNGTTTLTDLVGSNDGTLTNMDAATDWVSDTSNGGVRALDFDGSNDEVTASSLGSYSARTISVWVKIATAKVCGIFYDSFGGGSAQYIGLAGLADGSVRFDYDDGIFRRGITSSSIDDGQWHHCVGCWPGANVAGFFYVDGSLVGSSSVTAITTFSPTGDIPRIGNLSSNFFSGRIDDIRIFDQALDASDIAYLYDSGNGRGIVATTPNTRRRRYAGGYGL